MLRSGHTTYETMLQYVRQAEALREGFGTPFPRLPEALVQLTEEASGDPAAPPSGWEKSTGGPSDPDAARDLPVRPAENPLLPENFLELTRRQSLRRHPTLRAASRPSAKRR